MMSTIENHNHNFASQNSITVKVDPVSEEESSAQSPSRNQRIRVLVGSNSQSPTTVLDFMGTARNDGSEGHHSSNCDISAVETSEKRLEDDDSHQSLQQMIRQSLSEIEGVMDEIMSPAAKVRKRRSSSRNENDVHYSSDVHNNSDNEEDDEIPAPTILESYSTVASVDPSINLNSLQAQLSHVERELKQKFRTSVMSDVERISTELEETSKNAEKLKTKIGKLRGQLAHRRELRNRIEDVSKIVEESVNANKMSYFQDEQNMRETQEEFQMNTQSPTKRERSPRLGSQQRQQQDAPFSPLLAAVERSKAYIDADEMLLSLSLTIDDDESKTSSQEQLQQIAAARRLRFEKQESWGSFVPKPQELPPSC